MCQWGHCLSPVAGFEPASTKCPKALSPSSLQMCAVYVWIIFNSIHQRTEADTCIPQQFMLVLPPLLSSVKQCVQRYVGVIAIIYEQSRATSICYEIPTHHWPCGYFLLFPATRQFRMVFDQVGAQDATAVLALWLLPLHRVLSCHLSYDKTNSDMFWSAILFFFQYIVGMLEDCNMMHMRPDFLQPQRHLSNLLFQVGAVGGNLAKSYREHLETTI